MGRLRDRGGDGGTKYRMREKVFAIGDDFWIEDEDGERAFKVDGKALRVRDTLVLEDPGRRAAEDPGEEARVRDTMEIERGRPYGRDREEGADHAAARPVHVDVEDGEDMEAKGNVVDHEYKIERGGDRWPRCRSAGSGSGTPTGSRSPPGRTTRSSSR